MKTLHLMRYFQFYIGLWIVTVVLFFIGTETTVTLAFAICTFFVYRITFVPLSYLFDLMGDGRKPQVFGIRNERFFAGLTLAMAIVTGCAVWLHESQALIGLFMGVTVTCLDVAFRSTLKQ